EEAQRPKDDKSNIERRSVRFDHVGIKPRTRLRRPLLRGEIDMHDAEALRVAKTPLVIIEQRPGEVPAKIDPLTKSRMRRAQVRPIVRDAERIVDSAIDRLRRIVKRGAVLGDVKRDATIALRHPLERIGESVGVYFPA